MTETMDVALSDDESDDAMVAPSLPPTLTTSGADGTMTAAANLGAPSCSFPPRKRGRSSSHGHVHHVFDGSSSSNNSRRGSASASPLHSLESLAVAIRSCADTTPSVPRSNLSQVRSLRGDGAWYRCEDDIINMP